MNQTNSSKEVAAKIFNEVRSNMKFVLDLEERKYPQGRKDAQFVFFKKQLMQNTYDMLRRVWEYLHNLGIIEPTPYPEDVKGGYQAETLSQGSGYLNTRDFNEWLDGDFVEDVEDLDAETVQK